MLNIFILAVTAFAIFSAIKYRLKYKQYKTWLQNAKQDYESPIPVALPGEIDSAMRETDIGTTLESEVYLVGSGGGISVSTSDTEAWILSILAKRSSNIFEFGTATGRTTYLLARNSKPETKVVTITLSESDIKHYSAASQDSEKATNAAIGESHFSRFLYSGSPVAAKITQLFGDSKEFDDSSYREQFDMIFIDGSHAYSYVASDTEKALKMIKPGGVILWHDYRGADPVTGDVYKYLNELAKSLPLVRIAHTSLVAYKVPPKA